MLHEARGLDLASHALHAARGTCFRGHDGYGAGMDWAAPESACRDGLARCHVQYAPHAGPMPICSMHIQCIPVCSMQHGPSPGLAVYTLAQGMHCVQCLRPTLVLPAAGTAQEGQSQFRLQISPVTLILPSKPDGVGHPCSRHNNYNISHIKCNSTSDNAMHHIK